MNNTKETDEFISKKDFKEKEIEYSKLNLASCKYLVKLLTTMRTRIQKHRDKNIALKLSHANELLGEYKTPEEAHEAYGWGYLSLDDYELLKEKFETGVNNAEKPDIDSMSISWLNDFIKRLKDNISIEEYELMTPEQKRIHDENIEKFVEEQEERRKRLGKTREE